ncbi:MAG: arsenic resistance N-acetyltransferase ArsN2 [Candidatus Bathyarchaeota archaeon]|nr:arsenic resistance N-acetyltransferase ArsN2 [Candidatus Bathyarchaeota archaeon]
MNTPDFRIRPAQLKDKNSIHPLLLGFKLPLDGLEETKLWIFQSNADEIVGVAGLEVYCHQGLLRSVAVKWQLQNQGLGRALVSHIIGEAKKSGVVDLFLLTTTAPKFFEKLGFKEEDREKVTAAIAESVEFKSACPKTAVLMHLKLS